MRLTPGLLLVAVVGAGCRLTPGSGPEGTTSDAAPGEESVSGNASSERSESASSGDGAEVLSEAFSVRGASIVGLGRVDFEIRDGRIAAVGEVDETLREVDATGSFIAPAFVDSHVHLAYRFDAPTLAKGGVAAAVDLAAPIEFLESDQAPLQVLAAGPMITAVRGYPTQSWGAGGYGAEVEGEDAARRTVDRLVEAGARVIKVPVERSGGLTDAELMAVVARAHDHGLKVAAHALGDAEARRAAAAGADILAHTPVERLDVATVEQWSSRAVVSTLAAFGASSSAVENLGLLHDAGATVLYGTDLGNSSIPAIDHNELEALAEAGLDEQAILDAGTSIPAEFWGFDGLGEIGVGQRASFLILDEDPRVNVGSLASPNAVYIDGIRQSPNRQGADGFRP